MKDGKWTVPASEGACKALLEYSKYVNEDVCARAEMLALERERQNGFKAAITRIDVQQAIIEYLAAQRDRLERELGIVMEKIHSI